MGIGEQLFQVSALVLASPPAGLAHTGTHSACFATGG